MKWGCTGATIDEDGVLLAGKDEGNFSIKVTSGEIAATDSYTIAKAGTKTPPERPPKDKGISMLSWTGEVPPQKWMNFYTKVLSRFAGGAGLKITLNVEASPEGGVSQQKVEETKVSLRELGLKDDVKTA